MKTHQIESNNWSLQPRFERSQLSISQAKISPSLLMRTNTAGLSSSVGTHCCFFGSAPDEVVGLHLGVRLCKKYISLNTRITLSAVRCSDGHPAMGLPKEEKGELRPLHWFSIPVHHSTMPWRAPFLSCIAVRDGMTNSTHLCRRQASSCFTRAAPGHLPPSSQW